MRIKILNAQLAKAHSKKVGDVIKVDDVNGVPKDRYWRNRLNDAKLDACVEVVIVKKEK